MALKSKNDIGRRSFLLSAGAFAATPLLGGAAAQSPAQLPAASRQPAPSANGRRRLGSLEVSSVGLGVQNMSRTYQTTIPSRPEMLNIIRTAFDRGVTFFDAAEAYGPAAPAPTWAPTWRRGHGRSSSSSSPRGRSER